MAGPNTPDHESHDHYPPLAVRIPVSYTHLLEKEWWLIEGGLRIENGMASPFRLQNDPSTEHLSATALRTGNIGESI